MGGVEEDVSVLLAGAKDGVLRCGLDLRVVPLLPVPVAAGLHVADVVPWVNKTMG